MTAQGHSDSRDRVARALQGLPVDRVAMGPLAVHFCARVAGRSIREYTTDPRVLAECVVRYYERFRPDAVWLSADTWVSAEAMGAEIAATGDDQPFGGTGNHRVRTAADIDRIPAPDAGRSGRYPLMLEALTRIKESIGEDVFIVACFDQFPFSLASALMGINEIMVKLTDDPAFVEALMKRCEEYALAYGAALAATGADLLSGGDSPAGLIGPRLYARHALPAEQRVITGLKAATGKPVSLHICGNAAPILPHMVQSGADALELDSRTDLRQACQAAGPQIAIWGNLDPVGLLAQSAPADVAAAARAAIETVRACGHPRFILSSGCTLAMETPDENLDALIRSTL